MRKVRIYERKDRPGVYVEWREYGKVKKRAFPNKRMAEHFGNFKYCEINSGLLRASVDAPWEQLRGDYLRTYDVRRLTAEAKYQATLTLRHLERLMGPASSQNIKQGIVDAFIIARSSEIGEWTLNKDISNLKAFLRWGQKKKYIPDDVEVNKVKVDPRMPVSLTDKQIHNLLISARQKSDCWHVRLLLAITTGLRKEDIEKIEIGDIDFENHSVRTRSQKTRKSMAARPAHSVLVPVLTQYIAELPEGQVRLLAADSNTHRKWKRIRERAGLPDLRYQDLRAVFSSVLQARGVALTVVQELLEHSSPDTTVKHYTNVDALLRPGVERLPVGEWLS